MKVSINNKNYELPTYTMDIAEKLEAMKKAESDYMSNKMTLPDFLRTEFAFVMDVMGEENAVEALSGNDINTIDLHKVSTTTLDIINAYNEPIESKKEELAMNQLKKQMSKPEVIKLLKLAEDMKK